MSLVGPLTARSSRYAAQPLLSPDTSVFVLFIDVPWVACQLTMALALPLAVRMVSCTIVSSLSPSGYMARAAAELSRYAVGLREMDAFGTRPSVVVTAVTPPRVY
jgi:hypothetical protein